jgi:hypothetical protein
MNEGAVMATGLFSGRDPDREPIFDQSNMIQARAVANRYSISTRTLDRWLQKPHLAFPQPVMVTRDITGRVSARFWRLADLVAWERAQAVKHADAA